MFDLIPDPEWEQRHLRAEGGMRHPLSPRLWDGSQSTLHTLGANRLQKSTLVKPLSLEKRMEIHRELKLLYFKL